jgi:hypothetical protein
MIPYFEVAESVKMYRIPSGIRRGPCAGCRPFHHPSVEQTDWVKISHLPEMVTVKPKQNLHVILITLINMN